MIRLAPAAAFAALFVAACQTPTTETAWLPPSPPDTVDGVLWTSGNWEPHLPAGEKGVSWGNHRAVVTVPAFAATGEREGASASPDRSDGDRRTVGNPDRQIRVDIPWRRVDTDPSSKAIVVVDSASGNAVPNAAALRIRGESGTVQFQGVPNASTYYVYYLPWQSTGGYYPSVTYPETVLHPDDDWQPSDNPVGGRTVRMESVNDFHSFYPMEIPATAEETNAFVGDADWLVVPEYARFPVRMKYALPVHWTTRNRTDFTTVAMRGESHSFQLAVFAARTSLSNITVDFSGFPPELMSGITCYNCEGVSYTNEPLARTVDVAEGEVQPLWIGLQIPSDMTPGTYRSTVTVRTAEAGSRTVNVAVRVRSTRIRNHGYDDPASQSRLAWLNAQTGRDADFIIAPYQPVSVQDQTLSILGRDVTLGPAGLPLAISSYFTEEMTSIGDDARPILAAPIDLVVRTRRGREQFESEPFEITQPARGRAEWTASSRSEAFDITVDGALEYDGMLSVDITLASRRNLDVRDIAVPVIYQKEAATYMLGLGEKGRSRPDSLDWRWKVENHQEGVWLGAVNRGLQYVLRDENYERPLNTNFYQNQPLNMPVSWQNGGRGGIRIRTTDQHVTATNYSGPRKLSAGDSLHFNLRFLITPFKPLDTATHFNTRFVHKYVPVDSVSAWGGTVVNIHHANEINPYINYPFFNLEQQSAYIKEAHEKDIKVKLYYTIRELTYRAHELFAMRSLGHEIFNDGEGGGHSWLQEHLRGDYHSAWHAWRVDDAAILNKGTSRWTNYYVEGLKWLASNQKIDGLYLDDIAFSRETVKRMISVLHAERDDPVIDLHSANQFNPRDGYINSAMLYMEHFPYISRLWFGEYFEYDRNADYWMTEVSGLPFGLMGEMLQDGGHPYRGMLYGMTGRLYGDNDPRPVWELMNDFGIAESRMLGYWLSGAPVQTGRDDILATAFVRPGGRVLIAIASWADEDVTISLDLNMAQLGLPDNAAWSAPAVLGIQPARGSVDTDAVSIPAGQGLFIWHRL